MVRTYVYDLCPFMPRGNLLSTIHPFQNFTFHVARFFRDSLCASHIRYNGVHIFSGGYGHADRPDSARGHPAPR